MEGCGMRCIKYLLVVFNGLFIVLGVVLIATACVDLGVLQGLAGEGGGGGEGGAGGYELDAVLIAIGVLILVVAAFGCFGAWKESPKLLYIFAGCLILIIVLELSAGIAAAALRPQLEGGMKTQLRASFIRNKSAREEDSAAREFWDRIQSTLQCCGITGPDNYRRPEPEVSPAFSCCPAGAGGPDREPELQRAECLRQQLYYTEGCEDKVLATLHSAGLTVIVCGILFCFLEVAGIVLALWLAHAIKTEGKSRDTA